MVELLKEYAEKYGVDLKIKIKNTKDDFNYEQINDLTFIAFSLNIISENGNEYVENTMKELEKLGFNKKHKPFITKIHSSDDFEKLYFDYKEYRKNCEFLLDGIVVKYPENLRNDLGDNGKYPKSLLAIKFKPDAVITTVLSYEFSLGKDGNLTPIVNMVPVELGGTMISKASASNLGKIKEKGIYPGCQVELVKFGEIIPGIVRVVEKSPQHNEYEKYINDFIKNHS